jgi:hypothetical protein
MPTRLLRAVLPFLVACTFGPPFAHAEIYTWVDASGKVNLSNMTPPEGVRVTRVTPEPPPRIAAAVEVAREAARKAEMDALSERARELEMQLMSERIRQLEREVELVELSRSQAAQAMAYPPVPPAPVVQYIVEPPPPPPSAGCDPAWMGCGLWWGSGVYPASVVVVRAPNFRRAHPFRGGQHASLQRPMRLPEQPMRVPERPVRLPGIAPRSPHRR